MNDDIGITKVCLYALVIFFKFKVFRVRQLPWQRLKVRKMKKTLEDIYHEQLPNHLKENKRRRILSDVPSRRKPPSNCPDWVIRSDWDASEDRESENERGAREED